VAVGPIENDPVKPVSYSLLTSQIEWVRGEALRRGVSASDVIREVIDCGRPVYEDDMAALTRRRAARKAAV
jgi:hypothetical protein